MLTQQQRVAGLSPELAQCAQVIEHALLRRRTDEAERNAIAALARAPKHPEMLRLFGLVQLRRGRNEDALYALLQARAARPNDPMIYYAMGSAYEVIRDFARSRQALRRACELGADDAACWFNYGRRLAIDGDTEAAIPPLRHAVALAPQYVPARILLANMLRADGDTTAAEHYRGIIADNPTGAGQAWWGLAMLKPMPLGRADIDTMQRVLSGNAVGAADRIAIGFALAIALERQGDFAAAFDALQAAHMLARRSGSYDAAAFTRRVGDVLEAFAPPPLGTSAAQGEQAIFIVSLPRAGSTLTEQILASHSLVGGGGEFPDLSQVIMDESDRVRAPFPQWARTHNDAQWRELGQRYLARTQRRRERRSRSIDKMPGNWLYTGAILAMLPQARVVVVRRDPLENCLGCYRYLFNQHGYTHDFADLAAFWRDFDRACRQWQKLYPGRVHELTYEDLVADPDSRIRALLEFCNLPFEDACLNFHVTERRIVTPSAAQVREPLRRDTARAAQYGVLLDPLRDALGLPRFGEATP